MFRYTVKYDADWFREHHLEINGVDYCIRKGPLSDNSSFHGDGDIVVPAILRSRGIDPEDRENPYVKALLSYVPYQWLYVFMSQLGADIPAVSRFAWGMYRLTTEVEQVAPVQFELPEYEQNLPPLNKHIYDGTFRCSEHGLSIDQTFFCAGEVFLHNEYFLRDDTAEELYGSPYSCDGQSVRSTMGVFFKGTQAWKHKLPKKEQKPLEKIINEFGTEYLPEVVNYLGSTLNKHLPKTT